MGKSIKKNPKGRYDYIACCFQGGGALGAYQVGVLQALQEANYHPNWFVGTSIGAINSAIAAGNKPNDRMDKLNKFWSTIATTPVFYESLFPSDTFSRRMQHYMSSQTTALFGQPNFFIPRWPPPFFSSELSSLSYYDTSKLRETLEEFVDFDRINSGTSRLSVGAVEVCSGEMRYFDSDKEPIKADHIMASGALPPGFPAVEIDGGFYWDGGLSSNSPISYVFEEHRPKSLLCFMVHLFDSYGLQPSTLDDIEKRKKDIEYSSRFYNFINMYQEIHQLKYTIHKLSKFLPVK